MPRKAAAFAPPQPLITEDPFEVVQHPEVDIVVELFGGTGYCQKARLFTRHRAWQACGSTANKKLLAEYGNEIFALGRAEECDGAV